VHGRDPQPGRLGQGGELGEVALAAAEPGQHPQVHLGAGVGLGGQLLHHQDPAGGAGRLGAAAQDGQGRLVVPVVQDGAEQVAAGARR